MKNWQKAIGSEEKLDTISRLEKVNESLTYSVMLDSLIVAYLQFVIMLKGLQNVLSVYVILTANDLKQGVFVCVACLPQSYWNEPHQNLWMCVSYIFIALEVNQNVVQKCTYTAYTVHIHSTGLYVH